MKALLGITGGECCPQTTTGKEKTKQMPKLGCWLPPQRPWEGITAKSQKIDHSRQNGCRGSGVVRAEGKKPNLGYDAATTSTSFLLRLQLIYF